MIEQILLADRHLQVDQIDRARDIYQRVVDADPGNAIAVVGLARCALADGDDRRAHELAAEALEIDPENDMARRMEARLSEVMADRGEPVERPEAAATPGPREMRPLVTAEASPKPATEPSPKPATEPPSRPATEPPTSTVKPPAAARKEQPVRKSLLDRLMGR